MANALADPSPSKKKHGGGERRRDDGLSSPKVGGLGVGWAGTGMLNCCHLCSGNAYLGAVSTACCLAEGVASSSPPSGSAPRFPVSGGLGLGWEWDVELLPSVDVHTTCNLCQHCLLPRWWCGVALCCHPLLKCKSYNLWLGPFWGCTGRRFCFGRLGLLGSPGRHRALGAL